MQGQLPFSKSWGRQGMHSLGSPKEMLFNPFGMTSFPLIHQEHCSEWDHLKKDTHTVPLHKCHTQAALAEGHTEHRATQNSMQEAGCRALQPILKVPPVLSLPSAGGGVRSLLVEAGKVCVSARPTGAPSVGQGGSSPRR